MKLHNLVTAFLFFCATLFSRELASQNLIPNPGFDDVNICHKYKERCSPKAWRSTSLKLVGYDYGIVKVLLFDKARDFDRKFIQTDLLCPLQKGEEYLVKIKIKPEKFRLHQLGAVFSNELIFSKNNKNFENQQTDIDFIFPPVLEANEWITLEQTYRAKGNEKAIIIGNFLTDSLTQVTPIDAEAYEEYKKGYKPKMRVHFFIDSVSLVKNVLENDTAEISMGLQNESRLDLKSALDTTETIHHLTQNANLEFENTKGLNPDGNQNSITESNLKSEVFPKGGTDETETTDRKINQNAPDVISQSQPEAKLQDKELPETDKIPEPAMSQECDLEANRIRIYQDSIRHSFGRIRINPVKNKNKTEPELNSIPR